MSVLNLTERQRSKTENWELAIPLAFTAGGVDVTGYLAVRNFTSHVTGATATMAADITHSTLDKVLPVMLVFALFMIGAAVVTIHLNWLRRRNSVAEYAWPILLECSLLVLAAFTASTAHAFWTVGLLAFTMGLQNASITNISEKEIRTTHITATTTDIGIQLGRALFWNRRRDAEPVRSDRMHALLLCLLVLAFFGGGVAVVPAYGRFGFHVLLGFVVLLFIPTVGPLYRDLKRAR